VDLESLGLSFSLERPSELERVALAKQDLSDQVYLDEVKLEATRKALNEITSGIRLFVASDQTLPTLSRRRGYSAILPTVHTLNAA